MVGASNGGVAALTALTATLPADLDACVLIVLHIGAHESALSRILSKRCPLPVKEARDGERLERGQVRTAPGDLHLLVEENVTRLFRGPKEHHTRPAIDPLFRTAAVNHGANVVGVILTGEMDDGTAGLQAIKAVGGLCVVQAPATAVAPSMPISALRYAPVDFCVPVEEMAPLFALRHESAGADGHEAKLGQVRLENALMLRRGNPMDHLSAMARPSPYTCPDCHGGLWELNASAPALYRCHTGHAYTSRTLQDAMAWASDESGWNALRAMQERESLLLHMASRCDDPREAELMRATASELNQQAFSMRRLLQQSLGRVE